jgi:hypothetical protein
MPKTCSSIKCIYFKETFRWGYNDTWQCYYDIRPVEIEYGRIPCSKCTTEKKEDNAGE